MKVIFELDDKQIQKLAEWSAEQDKIVVERQQLKANEEQDPFLVALASDGIPYYGAIGGELTYCFTPNSIGMVVVVKHGATGAEINLTNYADW